MQKMHSAILCKALTGYENLTLEQVPTPKPEGTQVLLQVLTAGLNYPDVLITLGKYQFQPGLPFTPGGELCGRVIAVGEEVSKLKVGDRVIALTSFGAFQEKIVLEESTCIPIPAEMPAEVAGGFLFTYGTSIHALKDRGQLKAGETCLILGASGGVGVAAIEICKALGAIVIAAASTDEKLQTCKSFGADHLINYSKENIKSRISEITGGNGVDVIYDAVGGAHAEPALRSMAWRGRYLVIGFVGGIPKIPLNLTLLKGCSIIGVFWGAFTSREQAGFKDDIQTLVRWFKEKKLKPASTQKFALKDAPKGIELLAQRKVVGKAIVVVQEELKGKL